MILTVQSLSKNITAQLIKAGSLNDVQPFHFMIYPESDEMNAYNVHNAFYTDYTSAAATKSGSAQDILNDLANKVHPDDLTQMLPYIEKHITACSQAPLDCDEVNLDYNNIFRTRNNDLEEWKSYELRTILSRYESTNSWTVTGFFVLVDRLVTVASQATHMATHDWLTGLHNERFIRDYVDTQLSEQRNCIVAHLEMDELDKVSFDMQKEHYYQFQLFWAEFIQEHLDELWKIARVKDGSFVLVKDNARKDDLGPLNALVKHLSAKPFKIGDFLLSRTVSCGLVFYEAEKNLFPGLLTRAERCAVEAKEIGGNTIVQFTHELKDRFKSEQTANIDPSSIDKAIRNNGIFFHRQPICDVKSQQPFASELLIRANIEGTIKFPDTFLKTYYMMTNPRQFSNRHEIICTEMMQASLSSARLFLNIEEIDALDGTLELILEGAKQQNYIHNLCVEFVEKPVSETRKTFDIKASVELVKQYGAQTALDDFGKHNSNLSRLAKANFDFVKIDKEITSRYTETGAAAILKSLSFLSQDMGFQLIAEGIETKEQSEWLEQNGIYLQQGYFWGRPT